MSEKWHHLKAGDEAVTPFNGGGLTLVRIIQRIEGTKSQSRVCFRVSPSLKGGDKFTQYDAAWFKPVEENLL